MKVKEVKHLNFKAYIDEATLIDLVAQAMHLRKSERAVLKVILSCPNNTPLKIEDIVTQSTYSRKSVINAKRFLREILIVQETKDDITVDWDRLIRIASSLEPIEGGI